MTDQPNNGILKNKISLKIFILFVLCALIPLSFISGISYLYVSSQLKSDAHYRLKQQCKAMGFGIYERLQFLENELFTIAKDINREYWQYKMPRPYDPLTREGSRYMSIILYGQDRLYAPIIGPTITEPPKIDPKHLDHLRLGKSIIVMQKTQTNRPDLFMIRLLDPARPSKGHLIAKIQPLYLWGIGAEGALPQSLEMVVCQPGKQILVSSFQDYEFSRPLLDRYRDNSFSGVFESPHQGEPFISSYWSLFLNHRFKVSDWVVILSQSRSSILAPVSKFSTTFLLMILLTFLVITLMATSSIRKRMRPVEALKAGAEKIAHGDLEHRVILSSGDEFEVLAEAFNDMGQKLKKSQAMMVQATKMSTYGQMAAGIVHEIGQPLTSISGYTELIGPHLTGDKPVRYITIVRQEIKRLSEIIAKFRTFSRTSEEIYASVQINAVVHHVHKLLEHQLKINDVEIHLDLHEKLPEISGDQNGLQQVLLNLSMNAIDAMEEKPPEQRRLEIRTFVESNNLMIEIEDTGCGIPAHLQKDIFEPFFTTKSEEKGTGLGLAILQSILHKHHAVVQLTSEEDVGTCFSISIPIPPQETLLDQQ